MKKSFLIATALLCLQATAAHAISHSSVKTLDGAIARCAEGANIPFAYRISSLDAVRKDDDVVMTLRLQTLTCTENTQNKTKSYSFAEAPLPVHKADKSRGDDKGMPHELIEDFSAYRLVSYDDSKTASSNFITTAVDVRDDLPLQDLQLVLKNAGKDLDRAHKTSRVVFLQFMYKVTVDGQVIKNNLMAGGSFNLILQAGPNGNVEMLVR